MKALFGVLFIALGILGPNESFGQTQPFCLVDSSKINGDAPAIRIDVTASGQSEAVLETVNLWHHRLDNKSANTAADGSSITPPVYPKIVQPIAVESSTGSDGESVFTGTNFEMRVARNAEGLLAGSARLTTATGEEQQFNVQEVLLPSAGGISHTCQEDVPTSRP